MSHTGSLRPYIDPSAKHSSAFYPQVSYRRTAPYQTGPLFASCVYLNSVVFYARLLSFSLLLNFVLALPPSSPALFASQFWMT